MREKPEGTWANEVAIVVDPLLADVWALAWSAGDEAPGGRGFATLLRMAYLQGYQDALGDSTPGEVLRRLGVEVPVRTRRPPERRSRR